MSRTNHKRSAAASAESSLCWTEFDHPWRGRGRVRAAWAEDGAVVVMVNGLTTQTRVYKALVREFFRKEWRARPSADGVFAVDIFIDARPDGVRHDVDNVAKALLDALTGAVFRDDSQVERLVIERRARERERVWVRARLRD